MLYPQRSSANNTHYDYILKSIPIHMLLHVVFFGIVLVSFFSVSQAQIYPQIGDDIFVMVQTTVRDSDGNLIVYMESSKFTDLNFAALGPFLDSEASRSHDIIEIDEMNYQVVRRAQSQNFDSAEMVASTILSDTIDGKPVTLARFAHDGYMTVPGDTIESVWTFIRPI